MSVAPTPVDDCLAAERDRQRETLSLIASENSASDVVLVASERPVPDDPREAVASGLRVGTPAVATRGSDPDATRTRTDATGGIHDPPVRVRACETVADLCGEPPLSPEDPRHTPVEE